MSDIFPNFSFWPEQHSIKSITDSSNYQSLSPTLGKTGRNLRNAKLNIFLKLAYVELVLYSDYVTRYINKKMIENIKNSCSITK